ncbi:MAG: hypothetical protein RSD36_17900 [Terrisporobacter sp.]
MKKESKEVINVETINLKDGYHDYDERLAYEMREYYWGLLL